MIIYLYGRILYAGNNLLVKPAVEYNVSKVASPITPILIPLGSLIITEDLWLGRKFDSPFYDFKLATTLGLYLFFR